MTAETTATAPLASLAVEIAEWSPDPTALEAARVRAADVAGAVLLGRALPQWAPAARAFRRLLGSSAAGAWWGAALASACRITEIDDIDLRTCTTPGSAAVPAALAVTGGAVDAPALLAGIAAGYEVLEHAAASLGGAFAPSAGTWPTRAAGPLGAAAAAGRTLGLGPGAMVEAFSLAAGAAVTGVCPEPARAFTFGAAVAQGIAAAVAAAEGLRGDRRMLERWVLAHNRAEGLRPAESGAPAVTRSRCKPYAAARQVLAGSVTLRGLVEAGELDPAAVVSVELGVPPRHAAMVDRPEVRHRLDTLASAQFQLATALVDPGALDALDHPVPPDERVLRQMATVRVVADADLDRDFPERWGARVEVEHRHGRVRQVVDAVPGEERFGWEELSGKLHRLGAAGDGEGTADELAGLLAAARDDRWSEVADVLRAALATVGDAP